MLTTLSGGLPLIHAVRSEQNCPHDGVVITEGAYAQLTDESMRSRYAGPVAGLGKRAEVIQVRVWDPRSESASG